MAGAEDFVRAGLALLDVGVGIFDAELRLLYANPAFRQLRGFPEELCREGVTLEALLRFNAERGDFGPEAPEGQVRERLGEVRQAMASADERALEREMADGQILRISYRRTEGGGLLLTFEDRTAERRAQQALAASEERYALASEAAEEAIYEWDQSNDRFFASPRLVRLLGRPLGPSGERDWDWEELIHPDDLARYRETLARHQEGASPRWSCEYRLKDAKGDWRWVSDHGTSVRDGSGRAVRMVAAIRDITERVEKDAALAASEERHILVTQATSDGIYDWNVVEDLLYVSENLTRILDFDLGLKSSKTWFAQVHPDDQKAYAAAIRAHFKGEADAVDMEYRVHGKTGGYLWVHDRGVGVRNADGRVTRLVGAVRDVSEIKDRQEELKRQRATLQLTLENMGQGITLVDRELRTIALNHKFLELMEFPEARFKRGFTMEEAFRFNAERGEYGPGDLETQVRERLELAAQFLPHRFERTRPDGMVLEIVGNPIEGGGMVTTYTDITERKAHEAEITRAKEAAESALAELKQAQERLVQAEKMASLVNSPQASPTRSRTR